MGIEYHATPIEMPMRNMIQEKEKKTMKEKKLKKECQKHEVGNYGATVFLEIC